MNFESIGKLWISHSAISDFETCPRLYYLRDLYRDPKTNHRIQVVNPYLTLGIVVHKVIEEISKLAAETRFEIPLMNRFERRWQFYDGKKGGFVSQEEEENFKIRGLEMLKKLENSQIIKNPNYKIGHELPKVRLFKGEDLILVGSLDWIEILPNGGLHIIDFKTGRTEEDEHSLQLPIYQILAHYNFKEPIEKISYWYLDKDEGPISIELNPIQTYIPIIREKALKIKKAIDGNKLVCKSPIGKCYKCEKYEVIISNNAEYTGYDPEMNRDLYFV